MAAGRSSQLSGQEGVEQPKGTVPLQLLLRLSLWHMRLLSWRCTGQIKLA